MIHQFETIEDLLKLATKSVDELCRLFPQVAREDLKVNVLLYLLKNSVIRKEVKK